MGIALLSALTRIDIKLQSLTGLAADVVSTAVPAGKVWLIFQSGLVIAGASFVGGSGQAEVVIKDGAARKLALGSTVVNVSGQVNTVPTAKGIARAGEIIHMIITIVGGMVIHGSYSTAAYEVTEDEANTLLGLSLF